MNLKQKLLITAMVIGIFVCMLDTTVMNIALPAIQTGLNVKLSTLSWALNIYTITFAVLTIPLGKLADIYGRYRFYIIGLIAFALGSIISGFSLNISMLIIGRGIQSIGAAIVFPASMNIGISESSMSQRKVTLTILGITQGMASALGPTIGGVITQFLGWRWVFFINIPLLIMALILCLKTLNFKNEVRFPAKIDWLGMLLSMIMLFSLTLGLIQGRSWGWHSFTILGLFSSSIISLIIFIFVERKAKSPMIPMELFQNSQFTGAVLSVVLSGIFLIAVQVIMPTFFTTILDKSELDAALMISPVSLMIFIWSPIGGTLIDKIGARIVIFAGFALMFAGYVTFSLIDPNYYSQVLIACLLLGSGFGIIAGPVVMLGAADFTGELLTASQSVIGVFRQIGSVLAVAIFVSSLSGNLVTAQTRIINNSNQYIAQTNLPNSTKAKVRQQVESKAHQGSNKSATKQTGISTNQKDQIIESQYHKIISSQNHQLSSVMKAKIHAQVTDTVSHEFNRQNNIVHRIIRHVKLTSKHELTHAFIRPYQIAVPFVGLSSLVSLLFYKRKSR